MTVKIDKPHGTGGPIAPSSQGGADKLDRVKDTGFAEKLKAGDSVQAAQGIAAPAQGVAAGARPGAIGAVAADLSAGRISPNDAVHKVVELALERAGGAKLPDAVRESLRAELQRVVSEDPVLASKARRLGATSLVPDSEDGG